MACIRRPVAPLLALLLTAFVAACDTSLDTPVDGMDATDPDVHGGSSTGPIPDVGSSADATSSGATINACGGERVLRLGGEEREILSPCGSFGEGVVVCDGPDRLRCVGQAPVNACGSLGVLPGEPGTPCGCGGMWLCGEDGEAECRFSGQVNPCGGCAVLEDWPGEACSDAELEGGSGRWACVPGEESLACVSGERNACGGLEPLVVDGRRVRPGDACTAGCGGGTLVCTGADALSCVTIGATENACGGCGLLPGREGDGCGCGGTGEWTCDGDGGMSCVGAASTNACGGCGGMGGVPGAACGEDGQRWTCLGETLACAGAPGSATNACGGEGPLAGEPGEGCGDCGRGTWRCVGGTAVTCEGDRGNACGGCAVLPAVPGARCGACGSGTQSCAGDGDALLCEGDTGSEALNACGGCGLLPGIEGERCGACREWSCDGSTLRCLPAPHLPGCGDVVRCADIDEECSGSNRTCIEHEGTDPAFCGECDPGWGACDDPEGPCGVDLLRDWENCGACGAACPAGLECLDGRCEDAVEPGGACDRTEQCAEGSACADGRCVRTDGTCEIDRECRDDQQCIEGQCVTCEFEQCAECGTDGDCPGTDVCADGECVECRVDGDCPPDRECSGHVCVPPSDCDDEQVRCDGVCRAPNACGGCDPLPSTPGDACGTCGTVQCSGVERVVCAGDSPNACGGCSTLSGAPGGSCGTCGTLECRNENALRCAGDNPNACGGCNTLSGAPGGSCGTCGTLECRNENALRCAGDNPNACGGCNTLSQTVGSPCGDCGTWECAGTSLVACAGGDANACGGCGTLSAQPGSICSTSCGDGTVRCDGADAVRCDGPEVNACGGCGTLPAPPGTPCGPCSLGEWACSGSGDGATVVCEGAVDTSTSDEHCGLCGNACSEGLTCRSGDCECEDGSATLCGDRCVDVMTSDEHCGSCFNACSQGQTCAGGACGCPSPLVLCDGVCREADVCGGCGSVDRLEGEPCGYCDTGSLACSPVVGEGLRCEGETSPLTDPDNCGDCGVVCPGFGFCGGGRCDQID
ncbi:MAG: hypothetical protein EA398_04775 [Deltaproteobacteria bacterium]|nr:MAG: hypothetical protein EA398_04775 [Deltaproteobacteria bacterium]